MSSLGGRFSPSDDLLMHVQGVSVQGALNEQAPHPTAV